MILSNNNNNIHNNNNNNNKLIINRIDGLSWDTPTTTSTSNQKGSKNVKVTNDHYDIIYYIYIYYYQYY